MVDKERRVARAVVWRTWRGFWDDFLSTLVIILVFVMWRSLCGRQADCFLHRHDIMIEGIYILTALPQLNGALDGGSGIHLFAAERFSSLINTSLYRLTVILATTLHLIVLQRGCFSEEELGVKAGGRYTRDDHRYLMYQC